MNWVLLDFNKAAYRQGAHGQTPPPQKKKPPKNPPKTKKTKILFFGGRDPRSIFGKLTMCSY